MDKLNDSKVSTLESDMERALKYAAIILSPECVQLDRDEVDAVCRALIRDMSYQAVTPPSLVDSLYVPIWLTSQALCPSPAWS